MNATLHPDEFARHFPNVSRSCAEANRRQWELEHTKNRGPAQNPKPEQPVRNGVQGQVQRAPENGRRYAVRIISFRARLCDPDNLCGKHFVDCLRYSGLLPDDTAAIMDYSIRQQKCSKKEERTEIEISLI